MRGQSRERIEVDVRMKGVGDEIERLKGGLGERTK